MSGALAAVLLVAFSAPAAARQAAVEPVKLEAFTAATFGPALGATPSLPVSRIPAPGLSLPAVPAPAASVPVVAPGPRQEQKAPEVNWDGGLERRRLEEPPMVSASAPGANAPAPSSPKAEEPAKAPQAPPPPPPSKPGPSAVRAAARVLVPLVVAMAILALLDIAVLDAYLHPLHRKFGIPWSEYQMSILGEPFLKWWGYFLPAGSALLALVGWLSGRWRGVLAGLLLFATGLEDVLYYALTLSPLPDSLPWLDYNPLIAWTSWLTGSESVTGAGLALASATGLGLASWLVAKGRSKA